MQRIKLIDPARLTPAQQKVYDQIKSGARGRVGTMFSALLHSPGLTERVQAVGEYLRYQAPLTDRVKELAISTAAAHWKADVQWNTHAALARKAGVPDAVLAAIAAGTLPAFTDESDRIAYVYVTDVLRGTGLSDRAFDEAMKAFGLEGLMDLTAIAGYYTMLSLILNALEVRPENADIPWRRPGQDRA